MNIVQATRSYERWLAGLLPLIRSDLRARHEAMRSGIFPFLRATFYRWAQVWPSVCAGLAGAPRVLAVGDLHVENFGTWRDAEGRLAWGINDFDEACRLPYTADLVRLAASACLSPLAATDRQIAAAILEGYSASLRSGGRSFVLDEGAPEFREMAVARLKEPLKFWKKLLDLPVLPKSMVPKTAWKLLRSELPRDAALERVVHRRAGLGSLGRRRYAAVCAWRGGHISREVKELTLSAAIWAGAVTPRRILYGKILRRAVRCPDPFLKAGERWIVRRLAPDTSRIELFDLPRQPDELRLLEAMGAEAANVHLGSARPRDILMDLDRRRAGWLLRAAKAMVKSVRQDWRDFRAA
jgi:hypothetical protein